MVLESACQAWLPTTRTDEDYATPSNRRPWHKRYGWIVAVTHQERERNEMQSWNHGLKPKAPRRLGGFLLAAEHLQPKGWPVARSYWLFDDSAGRASLSQTFALFSNLLRKYARIILARIGGTHVL